jgi:hypothetical protein
MSSHVDRRRKARQDLVAGILADAMSVGDDGDDDAIGSE